MRDRFDRIVAGADLVLVTAPAPPAVLTQAEEIITARRLPAREGWGFLLATGLGVRAARDLESAGDGLDLPRATIELAGRYTALRYQLTQLERDLRRLELARHGLEATLRLFRATQAADNLEDVAGPPGVERAVSPLARALEETASTAAALSREESRVEALAPGVAPGSAGPRREMRLPFAYLPKHDRLAGAATRAPETAAALLADGIRYRAGDDALALAELSEDTFRYVDIVAQWHTTLLRGLLARRRESALLAYATTLDRARELWTEERISSKFKVQSPKSQVPS